MTVEVKAKNDHEMIIQMSCDIKVLIDANIALDKKIESIHKTVDQLATKDYVAGQLDVVEAHIKVVETRLTTHIQEEQRIDAAVDVALKNAKGTFRSFFSNRVVQVLISIVAGLTIIGALGLVGSIVDNNNINELKNEIIKYIDRQAENVI